MTTLTSLPLAPEAQDLLFREARTANTFTDEPIGDDVVEAIYDLVKWAPTSMNTQPLRVLLLRSDDAKERLLKHMGGNNRDKTAAAPLVAVLAADTSFHDDLPRTFPHFPAARDMYAEDTSLERVARFNATLQIGYFLLGVRAAGLAAGPMAGFDATGFDEDLLAGTTLRSLLVVNIGHPGPDAWFDRLTRLETDEVVRTL
ncbi:MAG: malonic semialdehyde reductase [Actinomycetota bacterium]|nr:malonic semialdehyde reductase [Actinomycetota bacterium]